MVAVKTINSYVIAKINKTKIENLDIPYLQQLY